MSYETPGQPRFPTLVPTSPSRTSRPVDPSKTTSRPAWRVGKCLACLGKGTRTVYRPLRHGAYLPRTVRCERCAGTGQRADS